MLYLEKNYELRASDFDCHNHIRASSILDLFQDVAGLHATEMGVGFFNLLQDHKLWVVVRLKYRLVGKPRRYRTVKVRTWPLPPTRVNLRREYLIEDEEGNPLVLGTSDWVVIHSEKRRILSGKDLYPQDQEICTRQLFEGRNVRIPPFEATKDGGTVRPGFSQLDMNGHVNNIKYADFVMDAVELPREQEVKEFQIDYHREILEGMPIQIRYENDGRTVLAQGISEEGECMFSCRMLLEHE